MRKAQHIRTLLAFAGVEWEDKIYQLEPPNGPGRQAWARDKKDGLGLHFPNLPYFVDGELKMSQSLAILRYLGRKHGLYGKTDKELCRQDMVEQQHGDFMMDMGHVVYTAFTLEAKSNYLKETLPTHLDLFTKFIGDRSWLVGDRLTYVDFLWYEILDRQLYLDPECFKDFPAVRDFMDRFENLRNVKEYLRSDKFQKWPLFGPRALWGYKEEDMKLRFPNG
ncbi:unnamed protein product [Darwinula stevensoni]|uniref:glutathione transferase n=1 Tax=Darwinula stevensoni TaxID=69355 RepID=A0A7R9A5K2_9CRUS|nr:unnamed protein product [Darwinula stevensoni]CAG0885431.1 unnamed protein product [Darwinula stevensoni]